MNLPIAITSSSSQIAFDADVGSTVSLFSTLDPDIGDIFKYRFSSEAESVLLDHFRLQGDRLSLLTEASSLPQSEFVIPIQVTDQDGLSFEQDLTFSVQPEPTRLHLSQNMFSESTAINSTLASISVHGPESYRDFTFSLVTSSGQQISSALAIDGSSLKLLEPFDYEQSSQNFVTIRAEDDGGYAFETTLEFGILDENEPPTDLTVSSSTISEELTPRSIVATLSSTDQDLDDVLTYSLVNDDLQLDNRFFYIVGNQLRSRQKFDFEQKSSYQIRVQVSDQLGQTYVDDIVFTITDANEPPHAITLSPTEFSESEPAATSIALIEAHDHDHDDVFTFSFVDGFGDSNNDHFSINDNQLIIDVDSDFELKDTYFVRLQVTDSGGLSFEDQFSLSVTDSNDPPFAIRTSSTVISRELSAGDPVSWLQVLDPDSDDQFSFTFVSGDGDADNHHFSILDNQLILDSSPALADQNEYYVRLRVTDQAGSFYDEALVFALPTSILSSTTGFDESLSVGSTVAELSITGLDDSTDVVFSLIDQAQSQFSISGNQLILARDADFENQSIHRATVQASLDSGEVVQKQFFFNVFDQNDTPESLQVSTTFIEENASSGSTVARLTGLDQDAGDLLNFSLLSVEANGVLVDDLFVVKDNQLSTRFRCFGP